MELFGKMFPAKDANGDEVNYRRTLFMNLEDWYKIRQIVDNMTSASDPQEVYDVRFGACDYMMYLRFMTESEKFWANNLDRVQSLKTIEDWVQATKEFFPEAFNGKAMDDYDVFNIYSESLGIKVVPSTFPGACEDMVGYTKKAVKSYFDEIQTGILILLPESNIALFPDLSILFPSGGGKKANVTIKTFDETSPEYPLHKNKVTIEAAE